MLSFYAKRELVILYFYFLCNYNKSLLELYVVILSERVVKNPTFFISCVTIKRTCS